MDVALIIVCVLLIGFFGGDLLARRDTAKTLRKLTVQTPEPVEEEEAELSVDEELVALAIDSDNMLAATQLTFACATAFLTLPRHEAIETTLGLLEEQEAEVVVQLFLNLSQLAAGMILTYTEAEGFSADDYLQWLALENLKKFQGDLNE